MTINDTRRPPNVNLTILCITLVDIHLSNSIFNSISINRNSNDILHKPSRRIRWINILLIIIINSYDIAGNIIINIIIKPVSIPIIILIISFRDIVHLDLFIWQMVLQLLWKLIILMLYKMVNFANDWLSYPIRKSYCYLNNNAIFQWIFFGNYLENRLKFIFYKLYNY